MPRPRVVITGLGLVSSLGETAEAFGRALFAGRTAIGPLEGWELGDPRFSLGGQIHDFDMSAEMPETETKRMLRYSQFALLAAQRALHDAHLDMGQIDRDRAGTSFGTASGSLGEAVQTEIKRFHARGDRGVGPAAWAELTPGAITSHVSIHFELRGPTSTHSAGCVTGLDTLTWGTQQIREGNAEVMLVGGADAPFYPFMWAIMYRSGILAPTPNDGRSIPRPFSEDHNGIALVEGGTALVLESESHARLRGAPIYAEVVGTASVAEARPMSRLDETGEAFAMTIDRTLQDADLPPSAVDWICAHGTGYPVADVSESRGIETALGRHAFNIPVSSIRGSVGQSFASGGGFQVTAACMALRHQRVPPTLNFLRPAEGCRLDYVPNVARTARVRRVLINAAGVGGTHAGTLLSTYEG